MYVVIEYNQASRWPGLWSDTLYDDREEALTAMAEAKAENRERGRLEGYAIAQVVIEDD
jgi:hypothetical protein